MSIAQQGSDVVATGSGTIDTSALTEYNSGSFGPRVIPDDAAAFAGAAGTIDEWSNGAFSGPSNFGTGGYTPASSATGDLVGIVGAVNYLTLPSGYSSGAALADTATWTSETIAGLGLTPGTYTWTWGTADSFTVTIATPEPASFGLIAVAGAGLLLSRLRRIRRG